MAVKEGEGLYPSGRRRVLNRTEWWLLWCRNAGKSLGALTPPFGQVGRGREVGEAPQGGCQSALPGVCVHCAPFSISYVKNLGCVETGLGDCQL